MNIQTVQYCQDPLVEGNSGVKVVTQEDEVLLVPLDESNRHYKEILEWVAEGNTIEEAE